MSVDATTPRHRVVIIGSGFGGLFAIRELRGADAAVTMISRTSHHLFQPLLYQVATGICLPGEIAPTTRMILRDQTNAHVLLGHVTSGRPDGKNRHVHGVRTGHDDSRRQPHRRRRSPTVLLR